MTMQSNSEMLAIPPNSNRLIRLMGFHATFIELYQKIATARPVIVSRIEMQFPIFSSAPGNPGEDRGGGFLQKAIPFADRETPNPLPNPPSCYRGGDD